MLQPIAFVPLATLLRNRKFGLILTGALGLHIILSLLRLPLWECPFFKVLNIPCPGCGLTRACMLLLRGDLYAALRFHAFAPIFVVLIFLTIVCAFLPNSITDPIIHKAEGLERQTGVTIIILGGLILYWLARLLLFPTVFAQLIRG
jgi:hypothetical protein